MYQIFENRLKGTDWGELDVLVLDLPPGTGDVQLSICQDLHLSGDVAVTTPSKLAIADARKGIEMFSSLGVPTLALVENMAYFQVRRFIRWAASFFETYRSLTSHVVTSAKVVGNTFLSEKASRTF